MSRASSELDNHPESAKFQKAAAKTCNANFGSLAQAIEAAAYSPAYVSARSDCAMLKRGNPTARSSMDGGVVTDREAAAH
jgi:hypothetical protein